jgi:hypothetical protein
MNRKLSLRLAILTLIAFAFVAYFLHVDAPGRRTYQAYVSVDGREPWDAFGSPFGDSPDTVVVYRSVFGGLICYEAFHSKELRKALSSKNGKQVTVVYDTFSDFGHVTGYNVHSIDGLLLANGTHVLRPEFAAISGVFEKSDSRGADSKDACW